MNKKTGMWKPVFKINTAIARALMDIEATKAVMENTTLSPVIEAQLRNQARIRSTHYSTRIEGNKLTLKEAQEVIPKTSVRFLPERLRKLDHRARVVLSLFAGKERLTSSEIASVLGLSTRMVRVLFKKWVEDGWLIVADQSNRGRAYILSAIYRQSDDGIEKNRGGNFKE